MESLVIDKTIQTPNVNFDLREGKFEISGRSIPENSHAFFQPIIDWLDNYSKSPLIQTNVNINLEYINTSSSKYLLFILRMLESMNTASNTVSINWYCDDDDDEMYEAGEDYKLMLHMPFRVLKIS